MVGRFDKLFTWAEQRLRRHVLAADFTCEALDQCDMPGGYNGELGRALTQLRRQTQEQRQARINSFYKRKTRG